MTINNIQGNNLSKIWFILQHLETIVMINYDTGTIAFSKIKITIYESSLTRIIKQNFIQIVFEIS